MDSIVLKHKCGERHFLRIVRVDRTLCRLSPEAVAEVYNGKITYASWRGGIPLEPKNVKRKI